MIMKENEHRSIEHVFAYASFVELFFEQQDDDEWFIIWKTQSTLDAWNKYLKHNDHKNKIIQQAKCAHFRSQMHELSDAFKSIWCFAKWVRIESQLSKKLSQFLSLKWSDTD